MEFIQIWTRLTLVIWLKQLIVEDEFAHVGNGVFGLIATICDELVFYGAMLLRQLRQLILFTYRQIVIKCLHYNIIYSIYVILPTSLEKVHLVKTGAQEVTFEFLTLFISVYVFTFWIYVRGRQTKIYECDIAILSIYHNILWLEVVEHDFW